MPKKRVHEIAKEFNKTSKEVLAILRQHGIDVQSHMSTITTESVEKLKPYLQGKAQKNDNAPKTAVKKENSKKDMKKDQSMNESNDSSRTSKDNHNRREQAERDMKNNGRKNNEGRQDRSGERRGNRSERNNDQRRDNRGGDRRDNRNGDNRNGRSGEGRDNNRGGYRNNRNGEGRNNRSGYHNDRNGDNRGGDRRDNRNGDNRGGYRNDRNGDNRGGNRNDRNGDNRGGYRNDRNGDNRGGYRNDHNNDNRGNRNGDNRRNDRRGGFSAGGDNVMNTKESRSNNNRHNKNREFNKNDNRGGYNAYSNGPKHNKKNKQNNKKTNIQPPKPQQPKEEKVDEIRNIILPNPCTMKELADACKVTPAVIIKKLFLDGKMVTINTEFSFEDAAEIAMDYNCIAEEEVKVDRIEELLKEEDEDESKMVPRPPVVCVMGHVDHGKTSLLDRIRKTHVTEGEAGGITQHIGAYVVPINGEKITFLDTPGHEAFTSMRLRGAQATDIAVLVVAADDGVMPQTIEAINHAKSAGVEVIVAVNKIDKEGANIDRVKQELTEYGLVADDWGGTTSFVPVSAKTGEGISDLLETITLTAEIMELKANPDRLARGLVIEAKLDKGRGPVATILIQKGTLHVGDTINVGHTYGRVRAMVNDKGQRVKSAGPSVPVEILGLNDVPFSGDTMIAHESEKEARSTAEAFVAYSREKMIEDTKSKLSLDDLFDQIQAGKVKELNLIVKADVQGSVEAVKQSLEKLSNEEVKITVIHGAVGAINESDVTLAAASNAIIIGFNVRPDSLAKAMAEREKIDMRLYRVIYNAIEDIEAAMKGMLDPVYQEKVIGHLDVRQLYKASGVGTIAGCYVTDGSVTKDSQVRLVRDGIVVYEGTLASLKRFKDDAKEVKQGFECGIVFEKFNDIKEGDQVEAFVMEEIPR